MPRFPNLLPSCLLLASLVLTARAGEAAELGLLQPVLENGQPLSRPDPRGRSVPVVVRLDAGPLHDRIQQEARMGAIAAMLALDEAARAVAGQSGADPTWLYLSLEEGGFARSGFWLREDGRDAYLDQPFVDLVVDADSIEDGSFEEIFAHEMGHVFLRRLMPRLPAGPSRTPHHAYTVTDYPTAFDEGFAIHFQALARRISANPRLSDQDLGFDARPLLPYWLGNRDRAARIDALRRNLFVQAALTPPGEGDARLRHDRSPLFDPRRLKSGQQMLSTEGVVATLFHRWIGPVDAAALPARYRPWFEAMQALDRRSPGPDAPLPIGLLAELKALHPEAGAEAIAMFVDTTHGATLSRSLAATADALAAAGLVGDIEAFVGGLGPARKALAAARQQAIDDPPVLDDALGPGLWLLGPGDMALPVNLNTAERPHLRHLGLDQDAADRLLASRRADGDFAGLDEAVARAALGPAVGRQLARAADAMSAAGTTPRR